jgi:TfoX/Sxy family transcriptional regulator of competence genes
MRMPPHEHPHRERDSIEKRTKTTSTIRSSVGGLGSPSAISTLLDGRPPGSNRWRRTIGAVAYDEALAARIRDLIGDDSSLTEKKMFGGLAFLIGGNMAVGASGQGGILVRVDPEESAELVATTNAYLMEMRGRQMQGWLRVNADALGRDDELAKWVELGTTYARSLPAKS